jgi:glutamine synthetase
MGHASAKDQQLDDHYFGSIPDRVSAFMREFEYESLRLGIPIKTRHNEVAPNQYECAPIYEEANLAVDHNQLIMDLMSKTAKKHKLRVLFHEKPFKDINGSGKHNNWSMGTNTGVNLLSPGKNPKSNLQFLTFLIVTVKAVDVYADLLRATIMSAGNEHRLGASEAPPAIISVFLGTELTKALKGIEQRVSTKKMTPDEKTELKLDIGKIPEILLDNTDRNRTSPFAFTGNRFEFRAVGSSQNCAAPMIALNTAVAQQLKEFKTEVDKLINKGIKKDEAIFQILKKYIVESKKILFEGNGYSEEWVLEAEKRGLSNIKDMPQATKAFVSEKAIKLFENNSVLSKRELEARQEIRQEIYVKKIQIEARVLGDLAINHIVPTAIKYQNVLIQNVQSLKTLLGDVEYNNMGNTQIDTIKNISTNIKEIKELVTEMIEERKIGNNIENMEARAEHYNKKVKPYLELVRYRIDKLELIIDDEFWPLPKYRELLFL